MRRWGPRGVMRMRGRNEVSGVCKATNEMFAYELGKGWRKARADERDEVCGRFREGTNVRKACTARWPSGSSGGGDMGVLVAVPTYKKVSVVAA
jgi:hypothetical protein